MKMEQTECSETSAYKIQTPGGDYPEESIQHTEHDESLKSRILDIYFLLLSRKLQPSGNNGNLNYQKVLLQYNVCKWCENVL